jgi:hypothetical protein
MDAAGTEDLDCGVLMREVRRYLSAVETFRAEGHEPRWRVERHLGRAPVPRAAELLLAASEGFARLDPG